MVLLHVLVSLPLVSLHVLMLTVFDVICGSFSTSESLGSVGASVRCDSSLASCIPGTPLCIPILALVERA